MLASTGTPFAGHDGRDLGGVRLKGVSVGISNSFCLLLADSVVIVVVLVVGGRYRAEGSLRLWHGVGRVGRSSVATIVSLLVSCLCADVRV